jgi:UDP-glucose 4-epimerase
MDARIARHVSKKEAIEHFHKTVHNGLAPMVGRVKIDNYIWGVRDYGKLVTVCFCCQCCCTILTSLKYFPKNALDSVVTLQGIYIKIIQAFCDGCGICVDECPAEALKAEDLKVVHDLEKCKTCGRCVAVCPTHAVRVEVEDIDKAIETLTERIKPMADLG